MFNSFGIVSITKLHFYERDMVSPYMLDFRSVSDLLLFCLNMAPILLVRATVDFIKLGNRILSGEFFGRKTSDNEEKF